MRNSIALTLMLLVSGCSAQSYDAQAAIEIHASANLRTELIEATRAFGQKNGFEVHAGNELVRDGRRVEQIDLERSDGVLFTLDNFMREDVLEAAFYAKKPEADWRAVKAAWLKEIHVVLNDRGEALEVPVGPPPSLADEARR